MSAVLLAVFEDYATADRVRMQLFEEGFPTDRYDLNACCEPGRAGLYLADCLHNQFVKYFRTLLPAADAMPFAEQFAQQLDGGAAAIAVHPRGIIETLRAREILAQAAPAAIAHHELSHQVLERAAATSTRPWVSHLWVENTSHADCLYCWLFERDLQEETPGPAA